MHIVVGFGEGSRESIGGKREIALILEEVVLFRRGISGCLREYCAFL